MVIYRWYVFFTGMMTEGGKTVEIYAEYNQIPVFVKEGAFTLYDDDFETFDYEKKQNRIVIEKHPGCGFTVTGETAEGSRYRFKDEGRVSIWQL